MNPWAFRAALRASAKVAFGAALVGCGGMIGSEAESSQPIDAAPGRSDASRAVDANLPTDDASVAAEDARPGVAACDPPPASSLLPEGLHVDASAEITEATFDCCVNRLEAVPVGEAGADFRDAAAADPGLAACCAVVIARLDYEFTQTINDPDASQAVAQLDQQTSAPVRWACCGVTPSEGPTCTPWGPPMPPEMEEVA
jgi:hypothetical protein